jgi:hypothetical protein
MTVLQLTTQDAQPFAHGQYDIHDAATWNRALDYRPGGADGQVGSVKLWLRDGDAGSACLIDGRLVRSISKPAGAAQQLVIELVLPSPLPGSPLAYGQDLRLQLQRAKLQGSWKQHADSGQWTSPDGDPAEGELGYWMELPNLLHPHVKLNSFHFPMGSTGLKIFAGADALMPWMESPRSSDFYAQMGAIHLPPDGTAGELVFVFAPRGHANIDKHYTSPGLLGNASLSFSTDEKSGAGDVMVQSPVILAYGLAPIKDEHTWTLLTQWRGMTNGTESSALRLKPLSFAQLVQGTWNKVVTQLADGGRHTEHALSWLPLPSISALGADTFALIGMRRNQADDTSKATNLAPSTDGKLLVSQRLELTIKPLGLTVRGNLPAVPLPSWHESLSKEANPVESLVRKDVGAAWAARHASADDPGLIAHWRIPVDEIVGSLDGIVVGSMELRFPAAADQGSHAECQLRGEWSLQRQDLYPSFQLELPCEMRPSGASDLGAEQRSAQFDIANAREDALQRESGPLIGGVATPAWRSARLRLRYTAQAGRNAVTELVLFQRGSDRSLGDRALYLQLRPFFVARTYPSSVDAQAGSRIAEWRSDDAEGPQWRLPDATVELDLPPQTVGEQMARGNRFAAMPSAPGGLKAPLYYRYAPPTRLVVSPAADRPRRYNISPYNLRDALRYGKVEEFTTELVYPVQTVFKVNAAGLPDIRIAETERFIGRPAPNLPLVEKPLPRDSQLFGQLYAFDLAKWAANLPAADLERFRQQYATLRQRQSAVRMNYVARLAEHHVFDPGRRDGKLMLSDGLASRVRDTSLGAPPLLSPLPRDIDLKGADKQAVAAFLLHLDWGALKDGALTAGVLHTIEFASELLAVLKAPVATSTIIDQLSFTALGANAHFAVSFDEGRTTFTVDVRHGQVTRLVKTRIGRLALLWNIAKHVIIYQRELVPSEQFEDEQRGDPQLGWPVLRKWEEFIEPVERVRQFNADPQQASNVTGFVEGAEVVTARIYVNGAWGRDLSVNDALYGYEVPLWNPHDRSGFYPKPTIALRVHASEQDVNRLPCRDPQHLYFYSNTEQNGGNNPDLWAPRAGVDSPPSMARLPVLTNRLLCRDKVLVPAINSPRSGGFSRPRFDLDVLPLAVANLQHARGQEEILTKLQVVTLARSAETAPLEQLSAALEKLSAQNKAATEVAQIQDELERLLARLPAMALDLHLSCATIKQRMLSELDRAFTDVRSKLARLPSEQLNAATVDTLVTSAFARLQQALQDELQGRLAAPVRALRDLDNALVKGIDEALALPIAELESMRTSLTKALDVQAEAIEAVTIRAIKDMERLQQDLARAAFEALATVSKTARDQLATAAAAFAGWNLQVPPSEALRSDALQRIASAIEALEKTRKAIANALATPAATVPGVARPAAVAVLAVLSSIDSTLADMQQQLVTAKSKVEHIDLSELIQYLTAQITAGKQAVATLLAYLDGQITAAHTALTHLLTWLIDGVNTVAGQVQANANALQTKLAVCRDWLKQDVISLPTTELVKKLTALRAELDWTVGIIGAQLAALLAAYIQQLTAPIWAAAAAAKQAFETLTRNTLEAALKLSNSIDITQPLQALEGWLGTHYRTARDAIDAVPCTALDGLADTLRAELSQLGRNVEQRVTAALTSALDDSTRQQFEQITAGAGAVAAKLGTGLKLVKAIGDLPALPTLTFNAARAEYVFDDVKQQIETSPFAVRLKEIGDGLQDLGLTLPSRELLDSFIPDDLTGLDFSQVFNKVAGIDFVAFFKRFQLPQFDDRDIQLLHGIDVASRVAWVKTSVKKQFAGENDLLNFGALSVKLNDILIDAKNDVQVGVDGRPPRTDTHASLKADWALEFSATRLAVFRQVTVSYDGSGFDFDVAPANIELHPALKFVSEFAKRFGEAIPPAIEIERDQRGMPVGARTNVVTVISNLPPLGPVTIGPLRIATGLGLRVDRQGAFVVSTHLSVGSRAAPVFVQVSYLGGGMYLEARAEAVGGHVSYAASVGVALGSMRALNFASIARGHYSILMYVAIDIADTGGTLRAGLSFEGSARILGMCNASLSLLLEAVHSSGGGTTGHGELHVEVEICWCYTLKVHRAVTQNI